MEVIRTETSDYESQGYLETVSSYAPAGPLWAEITIPFKEMKGMVVKDPAEAEIKTKDEEHKKTNTCESSGEIDISLLISSDKLSVSVSKPKTKVEAQPVLIELKLKKKIAELGITAPFDNNALERAISYLRRNVDPSSIIIAKGTPPIYGKDSEIETKFSTELQVGADRLDGGLDFHEKDLIQSVKEGDLVLRIIKPTAGIPGLDVYGKAILATPGKYETVVIGDNIRVSSDGLEFYATKSGSVKFVHSYLEICDVVEIKQDVDFATGNIYVEDGSAIIHGDVKSGFKVLATGNITVHKMVEDATISCGGDLEVHSGIVMGDHGHIKVEGRLVAGYAQNARMEVDGQIVIKGGIINCSIIAGDSILAAKDSGKIRGGHVRAGADIEVGELGAPSNVTTKVEIGIQRKSLREFSAILRQLELKRIELLQRTGVDDPKVIQSQQEKSNQERRSKDKHALKRTVISIEKTKHLRNIAERQLCREIQGRIKVQGIVYPGVIIVLANRFFYVTSELKAVQFYYDTEEDKVKCLPLHIDKATAS